jgi:predicted dehydrogenase
MSRLSRRSLLAASSAFTIVKPELVRGAGQETIKVGLVGCGGRGTQAVVNLMQADANVELVAMGDIFEDKLEGSLRNLRDARYVEKNVTSSAPALNQKVPELVKSITSRIKVNPEHHFVGFDAYKKVIASDVNLVMLVTPPGYRPEQFEAVINAGKHCWATKPIATDPVGVRRFMASVKVAQQKKLCVNGGTPSVSGRNAMETKEKIRSGALGEIMAIQTTNYAPPVLHVPGRLPGWGEMEWQHREWYSFVWICGDMLVEQAVHGVTFCTWMMDGHPERVISEGGASWRPREEMYGNIYDHHDSNFVFANGAHMYSFCRQYPPGSGMGRGTVAGTLFFGTKGKSTGSDLGSLEVRIDGFVQEHQRMMKAIRGDAPYLNEGMVIAEGTMTCIMAREAAYSGQEITWEMIMNSRQDLQPKQFGYKLGMDVPPLPVPGKYKFV